MRPQPGAAGLAWSSIEYVLECPLDSLERLGRCVDRNIVTLHEIKRPDIVETQNVIGVRVRVQDGIEALDSEPESLVAEIGRCIDQYSLLAQPEKDRRTKPPVARIAGSAHRAAASDHR